MGEGAPYSGSPMAGTMPTIFGQQSSPSIASQPAQQPTGSLGNQDQAPSMASSPSPQPAASSAQQQLAGAAVQSGNPFEEFAAAYIDPRLQLMGL